MLDLAIDALLVETALAADKVIVTPEDIDGAIAALHPQSNLPGAATPGTLWAERLRREGLDDNEAREQVRRRVALRKMVHERGQLDVSDAEVQPAYDADPKQWSDPASVKVEAYVAAVPPDAPADRAQQAEADAQAFAGWAATAGGKQPTKEQGMRAMPAFDLTAKGVEPALEQAGLALADGAWSQPVKTQVGWVVLHAVGRKPETLRTFSEVLEEVRVRATHQKRATAQVRLLAALRAAAKIEALLAP